MTAYDALGVAYTNSYSVNRKAGEQILTKQACSLISVTKDSSCDATTAYLCSGTNPESNIIATATFSGDVATFSSPQSLANLTTYYILIDTGSTYNLRYASGTPSITTTYITWVGGWDEGADQGLTNCYNVAGLTFASGPDFTKGKVIVGGVAKSLANIKIIVGGVAKDVAKVLVSVGGSMKNAIA